MGRSRRYLTLLTIILTATALLTTETVNAQTIPKLSAPEFSLELADSTVQITIKNQPVTLSLENAINASIYYNVRVKEHASNNWTELYKYSSSVRSTTEIVPIQSDNQNTILYYSIGNLHQGSELDFQVIALHGIYIMQQPASGSPFLPDYVDFEILAYGQSGWSPIQTITVPQNTLTPTETPQSTENINQYTSPVIDLDPNTLLLIIAIAAITIAALLAVIAFLLVYIKKQRNANPKTAS